ncbi:MAG: hypothetical protein J5565_03105, partial [Muribaculaceae bacterium]|nr:hypothetical protein [Muribaculaceae bacterium]
VNILIFDRNPLVGAPPLAAWRSPVRFSCIALTLQQENLSHFLFELPHTLIKNKNSLMIVRKSLILIIFAVVNKPNLTNSKT